ncbi:hypothetical protein ACTUSX_11410 [Pantoea ananatis]|uniref:hypothetical protein n=1 Tax=Pantoea ananas TaxID=553 RepID=UPI003FA43264
MKFIWKALLHSSAYAAQKLYGEKVTQVDVWLESGKKLLLMDQSESERLQVVAKLLNDSWTDDEKSRLQSAIREIRKPLTEPGHE